MSENKITEQVDDLSDGLGNWVVGLKCRRKPYGRMCKVVAINNEKVKIKDEGGWVGWVNRVTFITDWTWDLRV